MKTKTNSPAAEAADHDLAALGAELTRLRAQKLALQGQRDRLTDLVCEAEDLKHKLVVACNQSHASLELEGKLLDVKIQTVTQLLINDLAPRRSISVKDGTWKVWSDQDEA